MKKGVQVVLLLILLNISVVVAQNIIYSDKFFFETTSASTVTVPVYIKEATDLYAFKFDIAFDPVVLSFNSVSEGGLLSENGAVEVLDDRNFSLMNTSTPGQVRNIIMSRSAVDTGGPVEGLLINLVFNRVSIGTTTRITFTDVQLSDPNANELVNYHIWSLNAWSNPESAGIGKQITFFAVLENASNHPVLTNCYLTADGNTQPMTYSGGHYFYSRNFQTGGQHAYEVTCHNTIKAQGSVTVSDCADGQTRACEGSSVGECTPGTQTCNNGVWGYCQGAVGSANELCDGKDNDCDGSIDNGLTQPPCDLQNGVCAGSWKVCGGVQGWLVCGAAQYGGDYQSPETVCDGKNNDCDHLTDEGCPCTLGETRPCGGIDQGECEYGIETCVAWQWGVCQGNVNPTNEICDGLDNDCDGIRDEGIVPPAWCDLQQGVCAGTQKICGGTMGWLDCTAADYGTNYEPLEVSCDGIDNDCDGQPDEFCDCIDGETKYCGPQTDTGECRIGIQICENGQEGPCQGAQYPIPEICDGKDNDCDGSIDEELPPEDCITQEGVCAGSTMVCSGPSGWLSCGSDNYGQGYEQTETSCDGLDNDCDGRTDEWCDCQDGQTKECGSTTDLGECSIGTQTCVNGQYGSCVGAQSPAPEVCDGLDNDCNGLVDDSLPPEDCYLQSGVCNGANKQCGGMQGWLDCTAADYGANYEPEEVSCDGIDNDCDGVADEQCECNNDDFRLCGTTDLGECEFGTQTCANNKWGPCVGEIRSADEICDGLDNDCDGLPDEQLSADPCDYQSGVCGDSYKRCGGTQGWLDCTAYDYGYNYQADETSCDGLDNDCDTRVDEDCPCTFNSVQYCGPTTDVGACEYGYQTCLGDVWDRCEGATYQSAEVCDGLDNDCDGPIDEELQLEMCLYQQGVCFGSEMKCGGLQGWLTCGQQEYGLNFEPLEVSCDGQDNDCDGWIDEDCICTYGTTRICGTTDTGECGWGTQTCVNGEWGACEGAIDSASEVCDGLDNDCDGNTDEGLVADYCEVQVGVCSGSLKGCGGTDGWLPCGPAEYGIAYETQEVSCDGLDNDCNTQTDEICACDYGTQQSCGPEADTGQCQYGISECTDGNYGPCIGALFPMREVCDGLDNDCDGAKDEELPSEPCVSQQGVCFGSEKVCGDLQGWLPCGIGQYGLNYESTESSCDGKDNDCDGWVDEDCICPYEGTQNCGSTNVGECDWGVQTCENGQWGICVGAIDSAAEVCDGLDNDCDGNADENLVADYCEVQVGVCSGSVQRCGGALGWLQCGPIEFGAQYESQEVSCDGLDNDCDGQTDEICACDYGSEQSCGPGTDTGQCEYGVSQCTSGNWGSCVGAVSPVNEICDGLDNDCNGAVDEELPSEPCLLQQGVCLNSEKVCGDLQGWLTCGPGQYGHNYEAIEVSCDRLDNDCDGAIDEDCTCSIGDIRDCGTTDTGICMFGTQTCVNGEWSLCDGAVDPATEVCNGLDDDCDGNVDDDLTSEPCPKQTGVCSGANRVCGGTYSWFTCGAPEYGANYEDNETMCDRHDNDCDGETDEGCTCTDGDIQDCGATDLGICEYGVQTCENGEWGECEGLIDPEEEVCDGLDNDCDSLIDEDISAPSCALVDGICVGKVKECRGTLGWLACTLDEYGPNYEATETSCDGLDNDCDKDTDEICACIVGAERSCGIDTGACETGYQECTDGTWGSCTGGVSPAAELCDGLDNDCDGDTDEGCPTVGTDPGSVGPGGQPGTNGTACIENWLCSAWSSCINGKQLRTCYDKNVCGTNNNKPEFEMACGGSQGSCNDGIQNNGEQGVDCGGPCTACIHEEQPQIVIDTSKRFNIVTEPEVLEKGKVIVEYDNTGDQRKNGMFFELELLDLTGNVVAAEFMGPLSIEEDEAFSKSLNMPLYLLKANEQYQLEAVVSQQGRKIGEFSKALALEHPPISLLIIRMGGVLLVIGILITISAMAFTKYLKRGD